MPESEAEFQSAVIDLAMWAGWKVHHGRPAQTGRGWRTPIQGHPGFPDLALAHPVHGVLLVELKAQKGRVSPTQKEWAAAIEPSGQYRLWRPSDWPEIEDTLKLGIARPQSKSHHNTATATTAAATSSTAGT